MLGERESTGAYLALLPVCAGVAMASASGGAFDGRAFWLALLANLGFSGRAAHGAALARVLLAFCCGSLALQFAARPARLRRQHTCRLAAEFVKWVCALGVNVPARGARWVVVVGLFVAVFDGLDADELGCDEVQV